jgi:hypothetical protein
MDAEKLAELRQLHEDAMPGTWVDVPDESFDRCVKSGDYYVATCHFGAFNVNANARLIAAARNALPELLAEIERLQAAQRWIPVDERLPEQRVDHDSMSVWVEACNEICFYKAYYSHYTHFWYEPFNGDPIYRITHWRYWQAPDAQP